MFCGNFAIILILPTALGRPYCMVENAVPKIARYALPEDPTAVALVTNHSISIKGP